MRKLILYISITASALAGLLASLPLLVNMLGIDDRLKTYIVEKLGESTGALISVESLRIDYDTIEVNDIKFVSEGAFANFVVKGLRFKYNLWQILLNSDQPYRAIEDVYLVEPRVIFKVADETGVEMAELVKDSDSSADNLLGILQQFEHIDRIQVSDGRILYQQRNGNFVVIGQNFNGWLTSENMRDIRLEASGGLFQGDGTDIQIFGQFNLSEQKYAARLEIHDFDLSEIGLFSGDEDYQIGHGKVNGRLYVSASKLQRDSVTVNGYLSLDEFDGSWNETVADNIQVGLTIYDNRADIKFIDGTISGAEIKGTAGISDIFRPRIHGEMSLKNLALGALTPYVDLPFSEKDQISADFKFTADKEMYLLNGSVASAMLHTQSVDINSLRGHFTLDSSRFNLTGMRFNVDDFHVRSSGSYLIRDGRFNLQAHVDSKFGEHLFFDRISGKAQNLDARISGNFKKSSASGSWTYTIADSQDTRVIDINGRVDYLNDEFQLALNRNFDQDFFFSLQISHLMSEPRINFGYIENLPLAELTSLEWAQTLFRHYGFEGIVAGNVTHVQAEVKAFNRKEPADAIVLSTSLRNLLRDVKVIDAQMRYNNFNGLAKFELGPEFLKGTVHSGKSMTGDIDINLLRHQQIKVDVNLAEFAISQFLDDSTTQGFGELNGNLQINGNIDRPQISANLEGDKFVLNDIGYYKFDFDLTANEDSVFIPEVHLSLNNLPIMEGQAVFHLDSSCIHAALHGQEIESEYILQTIVPDIESLSGTIDYQLEIDGPFVSPSVTGALDLRSGMFDRIPFDKLHVEFNDELIEGEDFFAVRNHQINIRHFEMINGGQFHFEGSGDFPLYEYGELNLDLNFDGDILSLIPKWDSFFVDGASFTTIKLGVAGTLKQPKLTSGMIHIESGELWLADVARHIENINGDIVLHPGTDQVDIKNFRAEVDGDRLTINTVRDVEIPGGKKLDHWFFRDLDLDFGVLEMLTTSSGVELNIGGLMLPGETGRLALAGKDEIPYFYFAGPVKNPYAWGELTLSRSRITYPFDGGDGKPTPVTEFLMRVDWDVLVRAGRDLQYVRAIPAFIGEVDSDLNVDPDSEGLNFRGIIDKQTFAPIGKLVSNRGRVEYLDMNFRVENFSVNFQQLESAPEVAGRAWTTVRDSVGAIPRTIYLELYAVDEQTGQRVRNARWEEFRFRLVTADPTIGETQEQVLAYMGYSVSNLKQKATQVGGAVTENYLIRPLLRPLERSLERVLGVDLVRFNSSIAKNLFYVSLGQKYYQDNAIGALNLNNASAPYLLLIESSELTVGKYLSQDLYLTYTGQLIATAETEGNDFNFNHSLGLEYRFFKNLLLELEYDREILNYYNIYTNKVYQEDIKVRLRHSFSF